MKTKQGFTLIELLVVIAIIGILVSVGIASFLTAQKQARDAKRAQTMLDIQSAFEQYQGAYGSYPVSPSLTDAFDDKTLPLDPKNSGNYVIDWSHTATDSYCICAKLESHTGNADAPSSTACNWDTTKDYFCVENKQ